MADIILTPIADLIIQTLGSLAEQDIKSLYGARDELSKLESTLSTIRAVLVDAQKRQIREEQVKDWLEKLEDVLDDADDLVDEVNSEGLRRKLMPGKKIRKKVRTFFSSNNQLVFRHKMASRIKDIRERLDAISANKEQFHFTKLSEETQPARRVRDDSHSFVVKENVVGRDEDRRAIVKLLLDPENRARQSKVPVIPIVGMGGLGKTTLAQLVFNDACVQQHFDLTIWVCVSNDFSIKVLCEKIIKTITDEKVENLEMEQLQRKLREQINGTKYLLVLDDVWSEDGLKWKELKDLLTANCSKGSRIIVTTRLHTVANVVSTMQPYDLGILGLEDSWNLFKKLTDDEGKVLSKEMVNVAKGILAKCAGLPLAISMIGSVLLSSRNPEIEWPSFLEKELSNIPEAENEVSPTLRLSFDYLPSHLKPCFAYCSLFPKDHEFDVQTLISLWLAQGFVRSNQSQSPEEIGYEYFKDLLWRSFFQEAKKDEILNMVAACKMHDLVHDLAIQVAGEKYVRLASCEENHLRKSVRHVSVDFYSATQLEEVPSSWLQAQKLRSFLFPSEYNMNEFEESIGDQIISNFKFLRMLDLHDVEIEIIPDSIGKLKHLRYLDLCGNYMETLPTSITNLVNLQTLKLSRCTFLRELPSEIEKLVNLRHLEVEDCKQTTHLPRGLSQLTNLQSLSLAYLPSLKYINVNEGDNYFSTSSSTSVSVLPALRKLALIDLPKFRGWWRSGMIENQVEQLILPSFPRLSSLRINNCPNLTSMPRYPNIEGHLAFSGNSWKILEQTLKSEETSSSTTFPYPLSKLTSLSIESVKDLQCFPDERTKGLASLKKLVIRRCHGLKYLSPSIQYLTSLEELVIEWCEELEGITWPENPTLTRLRILKLMRLPKLKNLPPPGIQHLTSLEDLYIWKCEKFEEIKWPNTPTLTRLRLLNLRWLPKLKHLSSPGIQHLTSLEELRIFNCEEFEGIEWSETPALTSLRLLNLSWLPKLKHLSSPGIQHLTSLEELTIFNCKEFEGIEWPETPTLTSLRLLNLSWLPKLKHLSYPGIQHLTSLENLRIFRCEEFEGIEWPETPALTSLRLLTLRWLPKLKHLSSPGILHLTSLEELRISHCKEFEGFEWPETPALTSLRLLILFGLPKLKHLSSPGIQHLISLEKLEIDECEELQVSNDESIEWQTLTTLRSLRFEELPQLVTLPCGLQFLTTLNELQIRECDNFTALPDWICKLSSLQILDITECPNFKSVPASITSLTSLQYIEINDEKMGLTEIRERFGSDQLGQ